MTVTFVVTYDPAVDRVASALKDIGYEGFKGAAMGTAMGFCFFNLLHQEQLQLQIRSPVQLQDRITVLYLDVAKYTAIPACAGAGLIAGSLYGIYKVALRR